jgi:hypothetical protein
MVAKRGLMITNLGGTYEKLALNGSALKRDPDIPVL